METINMNAHNAAADYEMNMLKKQGHLQDLYYIFWGNDRILLNL